MQDGRHSNIIFNYPRLSKELKSNSKEEISDVHNLLVRSKFFKRPNMTFWIKQGLYLMENKTEVPKSFN